MHTSAENDTACRMFFISLPFQIRIFKIFLKKYELKEEGKELRTHFQLIIGKRICPDCSHFETGRRNRLAFWVNTKNETKAPRRT